MTPGRTVSEPVAAIAARLDELIVYVSDMRRSVAFYRDVLGLRVRTESENWSELETGGSILALHATSASEGSPATGRLPAGRVELAFTVADLDRACAEVRRRQVAVDGPRTVQGIGVRLAALHDPDGLAISLVGRPGAGDEHADQPKG